MSEAQDMAVAGDRGDDEEAEKRGLGARRPVIEVDNLVTHYPGSKVPTLTGVSLTVYENEIVCIMGGSGSGKSTLLRQLMALDTPTSGSIRILGDDLTRIGHNRMYELRKRMGVAFQGGAMFNSMSVGENLKLPLREHARLGETQMDIMTRMKLAFVNLEPGTAEMLPSELSGGMLKRAALARAIMMDPKLLLCDEPSAGLDPALSAAIDELILRLREAMEMTIVVVTHERESAFRIADRIIILDKGEILMAGTLEELRAKGPKRVQNLLDGVPEETEIASWI
jgi:phospholipid/cholesterol/gamma-HCH transport system ATP-binding protein